ncbi:ergothioneine biosynthesis protein EgtB [Uliginosibacterium sp. H1]|uniref:ergothioneine biosynthesis protein EgtB n=1 Tax=Uliginosibacterium sp. H1 TaxID=3114757 RepID=UPI002E19B2F7|nr:ergothioneine biosynthesis protein EgtB [Uliginosibacterium sp. H1]
MGVVTDVQRAGRRGVAVEEMPEEMPEDVPERGSPRDVATRLDAVRSRSLALAAPLSAEDLCVQSMPDASPGKWHLAHSTWFFETLVLATHCGGYEEFHPHFRFLFNSYYESLGARHARNERGLLTRPALASVLDYRRHVDAAVAGLIHDADEDTWRRVAPLLELGLHHEQQHQELLLTDIKHLLSCNPLLPAYVDDVLPAGGTGHAAVSLQWLACAGGEAEVGHADAAGFAFDNEMPRHRVLLQPFHIANRCVTCGEYLAFMEDGGYRRPEFWLSDGWALVKAQEWRAPMYWHDADSLAARGWPSGAGQGSWQVFSLYGLRSLDHAGPVCHLSFHEAVAYANWAGARLPTEFEWEAAVTAHGVQPSFAARDGVGFLHPRAASHGGGGDLLQAFGDVWTWTRSSYEPYPRYRPLRGAVGEYNGKFMVGQVVLRGSSCATPPGHARTTYRNFFPPGARWQFSGIRLAQDF